MPTTTTEQGTLLERFLASRAALAAELEPLIDKREEERDAHVARLNSDEFQKLEEEQRKEEIATYAAAEERFGEESAAKLAEIKALDARIDEQRVKERSRELAESASRGESSSPSITGVREPLTYRQDNQKETSYWLDLAASQIPQVRQRASGRIDGWQERLEKHGKEMEDVLGKRHQSREHRAQQMVNEAEIEARGRYGQRSVGFDSSPFETRAPTRVPGQGGYAVPPLWLIDDYIPALRPGRVAAGLCRNLPLPEGTDSINIPKISTPTLTGIQTADAAPVVSRDFTDTFVQGNVKTIAGQEDVPIQLIEQSPGQILDQVLTTDLIADLNQRVDLQVLTGNGSGSTLSGGQINGLYPAANWGANTVPWTNSSPAAVEFGQVLGAMTSKTAYSRFNLQDYAILTHPRRWFWYASGLDGASATSGRYIVNSNTNGFSLFNAQAVESNPTPFEGYAGDLPFGPKVYIDANVPITDTAGVPGGGTADIAIGAIWDDIWLFEGDLRTRVLSEMLSGTLELRFQVFEYLTMLVRLGPSVTLGYGTAYAPPYTMSGSSSGVAY